MKVTRRSVFIGSVAIGAAVALVTTAVVAFACTQYAAISLTTPTTVVPGETVTGSGIFFENGTSGNYSDVYIHFMDGPVVWQGAPNSAGKIFFSFVVPQAAPGYYYFNAEEYDLATGQQVALGTSNGAHMAITIPAPPAQPNGGPRGVTNPQGVQRTATQSTQATAGVGAPAAAPAAGVLQPAVVTQPSLRSHAGHAPALARPATAPTHAAASSSAANVPWFAFALVLALTAIGGVLAFVVIRRRGLARNSVHRGAAAETAFVAWAEDVVAQAAEDGEAADVRETQPAGTSTD